ncbi:hypothetical protein IZU99_02670 [Oscillospiraceae bacterium CM]|nr:hypothetical protein IZU99_02670 [Oscillospiraceae bacterium CM]
MDKELLNAIGQLIDEKLQPLHKSIDDVNEKIEVEVTKVNINIENDITKRLDSLFDGYMLTHEKQNELERHLATLQRRVEKLETKAI